MLLKDCLPHLLYQFKSEHQLLEAIRELSDKFTRNRGQIGDYLKDERLASAYTAFYLTTNYPKLAAVLKWMPLEWIEQIKKAPFIDLGAGPGTFSLAWKDQLGGDQFYQIETSSVMRQQAKKLWEGLHAKTALHQLAMAEELPGSMLLFGHSANEMGAQKAISYIEKIRPDHILFVEPGTKEFFPEMLKIRQHLLLHDYHILFPCPKAASCPMEKKDDWCHQFIQVTHDEEVERLSQMVRKDRRLLPLTVQAYSRTFKADNPQERLVRVFPETKFALEWEVCHLNQLERYQIMKRDLSKQEVKDLLKVLAGASLESELIKEFDQYKRVKIHQVK